MIMEQLGRELGRAQCDVVLGELDYLLGDHALAEKELQEAITPFEHAQDSVGRGQCLILLALLSLARDQVATARTHLTSARRDFERIGYRLGVAQCDIGLAHVDRRSGEGEAARARAQNALAAFRLQGTPRGQASALRLMAMASIDVGDLVEAERRGREALAVYEQLGDPWGLVESRLILAQVGLARGSPDARTWFDSCDISAVQESEPKQHWHLTNAWLAQREGRIDDAVEQIEGARAAMTTGLGDQAKQLLARLSSLMWPEAVRERVRAACTLEPAAADSKSAGSQAR